VKILKKAEVVTSVFFLGVFMHQFHKILISIFMAIVALGHVLEASQLPKSVYVPGFTGHPKSYEKIKAVFCTPDSIIGIHMPDAKPEIGYDLNRLIAFCGGFWKKNVSRSYADMGQTLDIKAIHDQVSQQVGSGPMAMFGCCRSGSAVISYVAQHNPDNLKAIVLESPSSDMSATLQPWLTSFGLPTSWDKGLWRIFFPHYPKNAIPPIDVIKNIKNKDLPILILHGDLDVIIPYAQGLQLYLTFKKHNFKNVHFVTLKGRHAYLLRDDGQNYLTAVHTFYKHYGLPYDVESATGNIQNYCYDMYQAQEKIDQYFAALPETMRRRQKQIAIAAFVLAAVIMYKNNNNI
jgi:hypothetical protein